MLKLNYTLFFRLLLPSFLCLIILGFIREFDYYPLIFALIISLTNWGNHKFNPYVSTLLSILASYGAYCIGIFSFFGLGYFIEYMNWYSNYESLAIGLKTIFPVFVIAPLFVFIFYKLIFKSPNTKTTLWIIIIAITAQVIQYYAFNDNGNFHNDSKNITFFTSYGVWQFIVALGLQLIIYQKNLKEIFNKNDKKHNG